MHNQKKENVTMFTFGLWDQCPESVSVAWGARAIVSNNPDYQSNYTKQGKPRKKPVPKGKRYRASVSLVWDRQSWKGEKKDRKAFSDKLNAGILTSCLEKAEELLHMGEMTSRDSRLFTLYSDSTVTILGNTKASGGYLYLIAFPTKE